MERNKKLILKILRYVRDNANDIEAIDIPDCQSQDTATVRYHVKLSIQAGYLEEFEPRTHKTIRIKSLTWQGHEYLEENCDCN